LRAKAGTTAFARNAASAPDLAPARLFRAGKIKTTETDVAKKKNQPDRNGFVTYNIVYEDGSLSSNRKVPSGELDAHNDDKVVKSLIEAQDRDIADKGGIARGRVKTVARSGK